ncbi:MAG: hypothetical protein JKY54_16645, partial [Flavobacteriales bacterium]|nr:hypothetical protein [Flavobacteriales bacterium]
MKTIATVFAVLITSILFSQSPIVPKDTKNEIGISINGIASIFTLNSVSSPYNLTYRRYFDKVAFRAGLGGSIRYSTGDLNMADEQMTLFVSGRFGLEWRKELTKRWDFYKGIDLLGGYNLLTIS